MPSRRPISKNDPLSRRDAGLEFLNVTSQARTELTSSASTGRRQLDIYRITNTNSSTVIDTHLLIIVEGLSDQFRLENSSGTTIAGDPFIRVLLPDGVLQPVQGVSQTLTFTLRAN